MKLKRLSVIAMGMLVVALGLFGCSHPPAGQAESGVGAPCALGVGERLRRIVEHRRAHLPQPFDLLAAGEQQALAEHHVEQQALFGAGGDVATISERQQQIALVGMMGGAGAQRGFDGARTAAQRLLQRHDLAYHCAAVEFGCGGCGAGACFGASGAGPGGGR